MATSPTARAIPRDFMAWQVALRRHTMTERRGSPHVGVAPLVTVRRAGVGAGVVSHSVICGLLPRPELLGEKTRQFREVYEGSIREGARAVYDRGLEAMIPYYEDADDFDPTSITTLLDAKLPLVDALRAEPRCGLVFHVFDLEDKSEVGRLRCVHIDAEAEVLNEGPVFDNVWWHNALFHGPVDGCVVLRFRHRASYDTRFGRMEALVA